MKFISQEELVIVEKVNIDKEGKKPFSLVKLASPTTYENLTFMLGKNVPCPPEMTRVQVELTSYDYAGRTGYNISRLNPIPNK